MKPQARVILLDLVTEFKMLFHKLFVMEVNLFYKTTLNKVGGEHSSEAGKVQCWALVTKLLKTIFQATHKARRFATEAGGGRHGSPPHEWVLLLRGVGGVACP